MKASGVRFSIANLLVPDLKLAPTAAARRVVLAKSHYRRSFWLSLLFAPLLILTLVLASQDDDLEVSLGMYAIGLSMLLCGIVHLLTVRMRVRCNLRECGVFICIYCGRDLLSAHTSSEPVAHCPNCRHHFIPNAPAEDACIPVKSTAIQYRYVAMFIPELKLARSDVQRGLILEHRLMDDARGCLAWFGFCAIFAILKLKGAGGTFTSGAVFFGFLAFVGMVFFILCFRSDVLTLRQFARLTLLARGVPLCQHCGYDLSELRVDPSIPAPCPNCGNAITDEDLAILTQPRSP